MRLGELEWQCTRGCDDEGLATAYQTNAVDTWGKRTFMIVLANGDLQPIYLFPSEYTFHPIAE